MQTQAAETQMTQDFEEAPVVEKKVEQPDPEEIRRRQEEAEAERLRQQQLEEERLRKEAEEAERRRLEEEQRRRTEISNRTRDALERANARGTDTNANEGIAGGEGNQGVETGVVNAGVYGDGAGTGTEGVSFNLAGRQARSLPKPTYDIQDEGIVVVEVTVDRNGNVTQAVPGVKGSTTLEEYFLRVAREAAMAAKFDRKPDAPVIQKGTITYNFILR
jgi:colicin import membrane protein